MPAAVIRLNRQTYTQIYWACDLQQEDTLREYVDNYPPAVALFLKEIRRHRLDGRTWQECRP